MHTYKHFNEKAITYKIQTACEPRREKNLSPVLPNCLIHRPDWSATEASQTLEFSDVETKVIILCRLKNAGDDQPV